MNSRPLYFILATSLLASFARANDWYVDAVSGSNVNAGTSPSDAWQTLTWAVAHTPASGLQTVHVAAGTYDQSLGEVFPIALRPDLQLIGAPGAAKPIVTANGASGTTLLRCESTVANPLAFGPSTRIEGLELRRADVGIDLHVAAGVMSPTLVDLDVDRMWTSGIAIRVDGGASAPVLERVHVTLGAQIYVFSSLLLRSTTAAGPDVFVRDSVFSGSRGAGVRVEGSGHLRLERCDVHEAFRNALEVSASNGWSIDVECTDSIVTESDSALEASSYTGSVSVSLVRCTLAHTVVPMSMGTLGGSAALAIDHSIVISDGPIWLSAGATVTAQRSLISDGSFDGVNGCFSGDPMFRDESEGDFRLRWASPCIDAAFVNAPAGSLDFAGHARDVDGDLDTQKRSDIGALEFRPLELVSSGKLGTSLVLESWGPQGNASTIYWTRAALVAPAATPFGAFELDLGLAHPFRITTVGASAPTTILRHIPNQIALIGQTYAFQALTDSLAAPLAKAFTNGVEVTIVP